MTRSPVEPMLHPRSLAEAMQRHPFASPVPVVADANVLIKDVCANLRREKPTALLGLLAARRIRLLVTDRVAFEVATRMERVAGDRLPYALSLWQTRYVPLTRIVAVGDVDAVPELSALLAGVRSADPDDVPTAYLALMCAPVAVLTQDRDLLDHGFGASEWVTALRASGELGDLDLGLFYGTNLTGAIAESVAVRVAGLVRSAAGTPLVAGALAAILVVGVTDARPALLAQIDRARPSIRRFFEELARLHTRLVAQRAALLDMFGPLMLPPVDHPPLVAMIGARLATSEEPLSVAQLATSLGRPEGEIRATLRGHPAFEVVRGRGWQIGGVASQTPRVHG